MVRLWKFYPTFEELAQLLFLEKYFAILWLQLLKHENLVQTTSKYFTVYMKNKGYWVVFFLMVCFCMHLPILNSSHENHHFEHICSFTAHFLIHVWKTFKYYYHFRILISEIEGFSAKLEQLHFSTFWKFKKVFLNLCFNVSSKNIFFNCALVQAPINDLANILPMNICKWFTNNKQQ